MKALIIGGAGFVGGYLADHLLNDCKWSVCITKLENESINIPNAEVANLDILNYDDVLRLMQSVQPDCIFHLAAQSSVALSWKRPALTADVNIKGAINVLEALKEIGSRARILLIGSGEEYGDVSDEQMPISESCRSKPRNIYAATKVCQQMIGGIYSSAYDMDIMMVRAFNHIGPRQLPQFVVADFASQIASIEAGASDAVISVGNLEAARDFTDVRDIVRAYSMIIKSGKKGETYNVGSGKAVKISELLSELLSLSTAEIEVKTDPKKMRPIDVPLIAADISKLQRDTGFSPKIPLRQTLTETLDYWRGKINQR